MAEKIIYEQPLNERIRTFLRLEHLFQIAEHNLDGESEWDSREALSTFLEITDLLMRSDIKSELIKDLERHSNTLLALKQNPSVDHNRLESFLDEINSLLETLRSSQCQPGQELRNDELVQSFKQRITIPGGSCNFDLPGFHFWINQTAFIRKEKLESWYADLKVIKKATQLSLLMIRNSTNPSIEIAETGFYQKPIESDLSCQIIRVILDRGSKYYPEISGGKHRFSVRFMEQTDTRKRPVQSKDNIEFELHCCIL